jgi:hypothetical protein
MAEVRTPAERKADTLKLLGSRDLDAWVASSSSTGAAHLVPLSVAWDGQRLILATEPAAVTTRNVVDTARARLAVGGTRDVVMIDAALDETSPADGAPDSVVEVYAAQAGWNPRTAGVPYVLLILRPLRIQAWREANEIAGRTLMRDGRWLVG